MPFCSPSLPQHQAQTDAAFGDLAVFVLQLFLGLAFVGGGLAFALQFFLDLGQILVNSCSTMAGGSGKEWALSSASSTRRLRCKRLALA